LEFLIKYIIQNILQHCCDRSFCWCRPTTNGCHRICLNNTDKSVRLHIIVILLYDNSDDCNPKYKFIFDASYVLILDVVRLRLFYIGIIVKKIHTELLLPNIFNIAVYSTSLNINCIIYVYCNIYTNSLLKVLL